MSSQKRSSVTLLSKLSKHERRKLRYQCLGEQVYIGGQAELASLIISNHCN